MKACENPRCYFHFEVPDYVLDRGVLNFAPQEVLSVQAFPHPLNTAPDVRRGRVALYRYRNRHEQEFWLCEVCHSAISNFAQPPTQPALP